MFTTFPPFLLDIDGLFITETRHASELFPRTCCVTVPFQAITIEVCLHQFYPPVILRKAQMLIHPLVC